VVAQLPRETVTPALFLCPFLPLSGTLWSASQSYRRYPGCLYGSSDPRLSETIHSLTLAHQSGLTAFCSQADPLVGPSRPLLFHFLLCPYRSPCLECQPQAPVPTLQTFKSAFKTWEGFFYNFLVHPHVCRMEYSSSKLPLPVEEFQDFILCLISILLVYIVYSQTINFLKAGSVIYSPLKS